MSELVRVLAELAETQDAILGLPQLDELDEEIASLRNRLSTLT